METNKKITRGYETVTPEKAQKWLGTSLGNRPINSKKVMLFMQYMAANEWNRDAQPIYFDEDGHLLDGHTRLNAVIRSGATIEIEVKRNFPRAEWNKLNVATPRVRRRGNPVQLERHRRMDVHGLHRGREPSRLPEAVR